VSVTGGYRGVVFDLGGVVLESPLAFIADYERERGLAPYFIARIVGGYGGSEGPWQRLERGELPLRAFCDAFDADIRAAGGSLESLDMMRQMSRRTTLRSEMLAAIRKLRAAGLKVGALTNNWVSDDEQDERLDLLRREFDVFVESCRVGMRKPEPGIYRITEETLALPGEAIVFLDDIGQNLKAARHRGSTTIKVADPAAALAELEAAVGVAIRD
jgi:putative hydrolase of the HAD superfamily